MAAGGFGFNGSFGMPFTSNYGLNYIHSSNKFSAELSMGNIGVTVDTVSVSLKKTELALNWHPFAGSFFLGVGIGTQTLSAKATQTISSQSIEAKVDVTSAITSARMGWLWGAGDGGFFGGMDFGYQTPSSTKTTLTTNADATITSTAEYATLESDTQKQGNDFGKVGLPLFTFLRIGYLF
jgi:hypothetical protein